MERTPEEARTWVADPYDFQSPYLKAWMGMVGITPINEVLVQTTMAGPDAQAQSVQAAQAQLETLAGSVAGVVGG